MTQALAILLEHMHKRFEINQTKIKGRCQSGRKVVPHDSKSDLPLTAAKPIILRGKTLLNYWQELTDGHQKAVLSCLTMK